MFGNMKRGVNAYHNVSLETGITSASPHKLIVMLYDGALVALLGAKTNIAAGNIAAKGSAVRINANASAPLPADRTS